MSPTKVEFYLHETKGQNTLLFACRLLEKLYHQALRIHVQLEDQDKLSQLDRLLWTFNDISFLPHDLENEAAPIFLSLKNPASRFDILMNLSSQFPTHFADFSKVIEFVLPDPTMQQLARTKYRQYRNANCELTTYKIKDNHHDHPDF